MLEDAYLDLARYVLENGTETRSDPYRNH